MIDKIKEIISQNSEHKHFVEYGQGVFATYDAVDAIALSINNLKEINCLGNFRSWQKENWSDIYLMSNDFMIESYLKSLKNKKDDT